MSRAIPRGARVLLAAVVSVTFVLPESVLPLPSPLPVESAAAATGRCGLSMPKSAPRGWRRVVTSTFSENTPHGQWPGPVAAKHWKNRDAGARDSSGRGVYDSSRTVSEKNGMLRIWIHSEKSKRGVHDPSGQRYVAAIVSKLGAVKGARITVCMRADKIPGYKLAYMLWPSVGQGNTLGEIDYPEGKLTGAPATAHAFMHYAPKPSSGKHQDWYDTDRTMQKWRAYTIIWKPLAAKPFARFKLNHRSLGVSRTKVPTVPMTFIMQHETYVAGQALPAPAQGKIKIDWITIDLPR